MNESKIDTTLDADELRLIDAYWRACNYLCVGMLYLRDNPLLREPLSPVHLKQRLLGHWGSDPGQSLVWVHLNRLIKKYDLNVLYISGPGHGAPAVLSNAYLEGTYSEVYPDRSQDLAGLQRFFKLFSFPGGIGSHCTPETPGSIHEGGELGYSLSHAFGAAFDNPELLVVPVVGDGEAETGPMATSWHSNKFLNPIRDGAVLPILHLNGYKIANPTILARIPAEELRSLFIGYGYEPCVVAGEDPMEVHQQMAATLELCVTRIRALQEQARSRNQATRPRWPMIILRTPKGWTAPREARWSPRRRFLAGASDSHHGRRDQPAPSRTARALDAELSAGRAFHPRRPPRSRAAGIAAARERPDERKSACERRNSARAAAATRVP